jgi:hypothetical protein
MEVVEELSAFREESCNIELLTLWASNVRGTAMRSRCHGYATTSRTLLY